jgi:hypothetical protein
VLNLRWAFTLKTISVRCAACLLLLCVERLVSASINTDLKLPAANWTKTDLPPAFIAGTAVCEVDSAVYMRLSEKSEMWTQSPITLLRRNGKSTAINLGPVTTPRQQVIATAFNTDANKTLYATIQIGQSERWFIEAYDKDGSPIAEWRCLKNWFHISYCQSAKAASLSEASDQG